MLRAVKHNLKSSPLMVAKQRRAKVLNDRGTASKGLLLGINVRISFCDHQEQLLHNVMHDVKLG